MISQIGVESRQRHTQKQATTRKNANLVSSEPPLCQESWGLPLAQRPRGVVAGVVYRGTGKLPDWMVSELGAAARRRPNVSNVSPPAPQRQRAAAFLSRELAAGPARSDRLAADAAALGIGRHQLQRARLELGIRADRQGVHTIWTGR